MIIIIIITASCHGPAEAHFSVSPSVYMDGGYIWTHVLLNTHYISINTSCLSISIANTITAFIIMFILLHPLLLLFLEVWKVYPGVEFFLTGCRYVLSEANFVILC